MAKIIELKVAEAGYLWVKIEMIGPQGEINILTRDEIASLRKRIRQELLEEIREIIRP